MYKNWKSVWITGASSGIGYSLAESLAASGATVVGSARRKDKYVLNYDINIEVEYYLSALTLEPFIFKNISKTESKIFLLYPEFNSAISNKSIKKISQFLYSDELELKGLTHFFPIEDGKLVYENIQKILV